MMSGISGTVLVEGDVTKVEAFWFGINNNIMIACSLLEVFVHYRLLAIRG